MVKKRSNTRFKFFLALVAGFSALFITLSYYGYQVLYTPNILVNRDLPEDYRYELLLKNDTKFEALVQQFRQDSIIHDEMSFRFISKLKKLPEKLKWGRYVLKPQMTNIELVNMLRTGRQTPTKLTFNNVRTLPDLAGKMTKNIALDSLDFLKVLQNPLNASKYGFNKQTFSTMFLPNTYEVYWTITAPQLLDKMYKEYQSFWTESRKQKAENQGLTPVQASILASIVDAESSHNSEKKRIAGLYLNRLNKNWKLEADPTVIFAMGDFTIKRVLNRYLEIDSPYNTYKYTGLPPGAIRVPSLSGLKGVLNAEQHKYMFMCAKEDFSGYHNFAITGSQHARNARKYRLALTKAGIRK